MQWAVGMQVCRRTARQLLVRAALLVFCDAVATQGRGKDVLCGDAERALGTPHHRARRRLIDCPRSGQNGSPLDSRAQSRRCKRTPCKHVVH